MLKFAKNYFINMRVALDTGRVYCCYVFSYHDAVRPMIVKEIREKNGVPQ